MNIVSEDKKVDPMTDDLGRAESLKVNVIADAEDEANRQFYGNSITDSYRLKSELVGKCMEEIGMGRFQWEIFIVTGFGWITDNL